MSNDPSSSGGGRSLDGGGDSNANRKQLTPQELRAQRLARFEGGGTSSQGHRPAKKSQLKDPPPSSLPSKEISPSATAAAKAESTHTSLKSPPPHATEPDNSSSLALSAAALAEQEDQELQAALALSMGLPVPQSTFDASRLEPLPAFDPLNETRHRSPEVSSDLLATAAMVVATAPSGTSEHTSTAPSTPMRIEDATAAAATSDTDVDMEGDDRKPAAKPSPVSPSRILRSNPQHFSGRVRSWYNTAAPYNVLDFHDCMWDKGVTTKNDQTRWLAQGIQFKDEHKEGDGTSTTSTAGDSSSLLQTIISGPGGE